MSASGERGNQEEEKPVANQGLYIELNVNDQWGNKVYFKMKRTGQLGTLLNAYCDRQSVDIKTIVFLFDGRLLRAHLTPDELDMKDGDAIDAMLQQIGGGFQFL
ncbi:small ubiquitin-related modifier 1-like [Lotus japonicus]|uniref:small ubiquitin-related modifier 1-like n=1 Tax=Lotus japonicus TaxID=34305 RepID=UPI00258E784E|nr:small ubiquitin-related modifier 1-like [Lotus japonicus]